MRIRNVLAKKLQCYVNGMKIVPKGIVVYAQEGEENVENWRSESHWKRIVHALVETDEDGEAIVYEILPWTCRAWHSHKERDNTHIAIQVLEKPGAGWAGKRREVGEATAALVAYLSGLYQIDPDKVSLEGQASLELCEALDALFTGGNREDEVEA